MHSLSLSVPVHQVLSLLRLEADAIRAAAERLKYHQLEQALVLLSECKGKVVLSGVGKSGIVAQKIAATLNSIGVISMCLHPCDALHGDLGILTSTDVVILLSNSGETDEILDMLPHLKHRQVPIISIVGNLQSTLARQADIVLNASVDYEACPLNLAPTASTTVALAIGDALAMTLVNMKGVTPETFAYNHPAGRLGKRLTLTVENLMQQKQDCLKLLESASWIDIISAISSCGSGAVNIVDREGFLLGLITDGDLRRCVQKTPGESLEQLSASEIMTRNPISVTPQVLAYEALKIMENRSSQISVLPVVDDDGYCLGLLRLHDILHSGLS